MDNVALILIIVLGVMTVWRWRAFLIHCNSDVHQEYDDKWLHEVNNYYQKLIGHINDDLDLDRKLIRKLESKVAAHDKIINDTNKEKTGEYNISSNNVNLNYTSWELDGEFGNFMWFVKRYIEKQVKLSIKE